MTEAPSGRPMIHAVKVSQVFERADGQEVRAVSDLSVSIPAGQFVCVVGPPAAARAPSCRWCRAAIADRGWLEMDGRPIAGPSPDRGVVFQKDSVFPGCARSTM